MNSSSFKGRLAVATLLLLGLSACVDRDFDLLEPADFPSTSAVFKEFGVNGLIFEPFQGASLTAYRFATDQAFRGSNSIGFDIPNPGSFAGGAAIDPVGRNLTSYNALSFWARSSNPGTIDVMGLANDNTGTSKYQTEVAGQISVDQIWTRFYLPIVNPSRLTREKGMFWFAEGAENGSGYQIWLDEVEFVNTPAVANPRPTIPTQQIIVEQGAFLDVSGLTVTYDVNGTDMVVSSLPGNFDFESSDPEVARVTETGEVEYVGSGTAEITASVAGAEADGVITVVVTGPPNGAAPTPTRAGSEVTSLFSDVYDDIAVDTWSTVWDNADVEDIQIDGDNVKRYTNSVFAGVETFGEPIDATTREGFHIDLWLNDPTDFRLKLVNFDGPNVSESEIFLSETSMPGLRVGQWNSLDIPFTAFPGGFPARNSVSQMIFSGPNATFYIDNVYYYGEIEVEAPEEPAEAAPTPTYAEGDAVSLFSNAYTDIPVATFSTPWDNANVEDVQVAGDDAKKYTALQFAGIETAGTADVSAMTSFRMDIWTPDPVEGARFQIRIVDFGPDGVFGGGDDTADNFVIDPTTTPALRSGEWVTIDVPLTSWPGLTGTSNIAQFVLEDLNRTMSTVYVDNIVFHR